MRFRSGLETGIGLGVHAWPPCWRAAGFGLGGFPLGQFLHDGGGVLGLGDDFFARDEALHVQFHEVAVEGDHAVFAAGLDVGIDAEGFVVADEGLMAGVLIMIS